MLVHSTRWVLGVRSCGQQIRLLSISHARHNAHNLQVESEGDALPKTRSFAKLGIRDTILSGMNAAFPHIQAPTRVQERFITAISEGKDLMLKDATGTGK
jgi:superfamily II DNA/RNA helicase